MRYLQSGGGYFYKEYKNGDKKRISEKEYKKKMRGGGDLMNDPRFDELKKIFSVTNIFYDSYDDITSIHGGVITGNGVIIIRTHPYELFIMNNEKMQITLNGRYKITIGSVHNYLSCSESYAELKGTEQNQWGNVENIGIYYGHTVSEHGLQKHLNVFSDLFGEGKWTFIHSPADKSHFGACNTKNHTHYIKIIKNKFNNMNVKSLTHQHSPINNKVKGHALFITSVPYSEFSKKYLENKNRNTVEPLHITSNINKTYSKCSQYNTNKNRCIYRGCHYNDTDKKCKPSYKNVVKYGNQ